MAKIICVYIHVGYHMYIIHIGQFNSQAEYGMYLENIFSLFNLKSDSSLMYL